MTKQEERVKCPICGEEFWILALKNHIFAKAWWGDKKHAKYWEAHKKPVIAKECGNANPNGNIALTYEGGCGKQINIEDAYRCTGCGGWFHKECIIKHFKKEKDHDWGRHEERNQIVKKLRKYQKENQTAPLNAEGVISLILQP